MRVRDAQELVVDAGLNDGENLRGEVDVALLAAMNSPRGDWGRSAKLESELRLM
jgi:hypothetical protein